MKQVIAAIAAIGIGLATAPGAMAQQETVGVEEAYCVYDSLFATDDELFVGEMFLADPEKADPTDLEDASDLVALATDECTETNEWNEAQETAARELALLTAGGDVILNQLVEAGVPQAAIEGVVALAEELPSEETGTFFEPTWGTNTAFLNRLRDKIVAKGVVDTQGTVGGAIDLLHLNVMIISRQADFIVAGLDLEDES